MSVATLDSTTCELLRLAAEWHLLGRLFERPRSSWRSDVARLVAEVEREDLRAAACLADSETEGEYLRRIGPGGIASPREVGYRPLDDPGRILAELSQYYEEFGFRPRGEDPPDHVVVEVAFVAFLLLKEAYWRVHNDPKGERAAASARERFLKDHLAALAAPLAERLASGTDDTLLAAATALAKRVPEAEPPCTAETTSPATDPCSDAPFTVDP